MKTHKELVKPDKQLISGLRASAAGDDFVCRVNLVGIGLSTYLVVYIWNILLVG